MNDDEVIKRKIGIYSKNNKPIHLELSSGKFYNGYVKEHGSDFIVLNELRIGEILVFFSEILVIEPYSPREVRE